MQQNPQPTTAARTLLCNCRIVEPTTVRCLAPIAWRYCLPLGPRSFSLAFHGALPSGRRLNPTTPLERLCITANLSGQCLLWVKSRHRGTSNQCPLYPQKRTSIEPVGMSALCQQRTSVSYAINSSALTISVCGIVSPSALAAYGLRTGAPAGRCH